MTARSKQGGFSVSLARGDTLNGGKVILAFGLRDIQEPIDGLQERWGKTVLHCPYCHGIEFSDQQLGMLYRTPMSVHQDCLISEWGPTTLYLHRAKLDPDGAAKLATRRITVETERVKRLIETTDTLSAVQLDDGRFNPISALYVTPQSSFSSSIAEQLGAELDDGPFGPLIRTNADRMTTVHGLYAAGDIARAPHSVSWAVADGVTAGTSAHRALIFG